MQTKGGTMNSPIRMKQLCWTGTTMYAVDEDGLVWFIEMKTGNWDLHGNPTIEDRLRLEGKLP